MATNKQTVETWSPGEFAEIRSHLESTLTALRAELNNSDRDVNAMLDTGTDQDNLDVAAHHSNVREEVYQAENSRAILEQTENALARLDAGRYGICDSCDTPILKERMLAFPRATYCVACLSS